MNKLARLLRRKVVILDGATGTNLLGAGLRPGESPSVLNFRNPKAVYQLQRSYVAAGSDAILTNTFSANPLNLRAAHIERAIKAGVMLARKAARDKVVIGDVGPLGILIQPYGEGDFTEIKDTFSMICSHLYAGGIRLFCLETFTSVIEAKAAFLAAREFSDYIIVSLSLQDNGRTVMGESPESIAVTFESLGAAVIGFNCAHPDVVLDAVGRAARITALPILAKPNAGRVLVKGNMMKHTLSDSELAAYFEKLVRAGAGMVGGCCGSTPEYIRKIASRKEKLVPRKVEKKFFLASPFKTTAAENKRCLVVGERLNPSGRKKVREHLLKKDYRIYGMDAKAQEAAGADALDINAFVIGLDEGQVLLSCVQEVMKNTELPLFVDTLNYAVAKSVLEMYPGIGVYNAIPARLKELRKWLPLVKRYGFKAVISLVGRTIPRDQGERMKNARLAMKIARRLNFPLRDMIFDPLVFTAATDARQGEETLKTVAALHDAGLKTILGISNISFGLPGRSMLNIAFAVAAIKSGVDFVIVNPLDQAVFAAIKASEALFRERIDDHVRRFENGIETIGSAASEEKTEPKDKGNGTLVQAIIAGNTPLSQKLAVEYLRVKRMPPHELIEDHIAQGLRIVGADYETGKRFIPDLLKSAESAKAALNIVKTSFKRGRMKGKIILATVKGDVHDIGKNVAAMIFEAGGYDVKDLGKNVSAEKIVNEVRKHRPDALGLSALLTTTMPEMENVIKSLRRAGLETKVIIGGPNVSASYAKKIGAFGAARNVMDGVRLVEKIKGTHA